MIPREYTKSLKRWEDYGPRHVPKRRRASSISRAARYRPGLDMGESENDHEDSSHTHEMNRLSPARDSNNDRFSDNESDETATTKGLFVRDNRNPHISTGQLYMASRQSQQSEKDTSDIQPFTAPRSRAELQSSGRLQARPQPLAAKTRKFNPQSPNYDAPPVESSVGTGLRESRYSGATDLPWHRNKTRSDPTRIEKVTPAALLKRGLKKGQEETVVKRGYGAYDPENVEIVNLKETTDMSFAQIADYLNKKRVDDGRNPTLTMTGVNGRYNRTAPVLFETQGKVFIPLSKRKKNNPQAVLHGESRSPDNLDNASWTEEYDLKLVKIVREYDADKWEVVRTRFEEATGFIIDDNTQLAKRFNLL